MKKNLINHAMKKVLFALVTVVCIATRADAQCNEFFHIADNTHWEMETYNAKGKMNGRSIQKVKSYTATPGGFKATLHSVVQNEKGKETTSGDLELTCTNGTVLLDMRNFVNPDQMKAFGDYELKIESSALEMPSKLSVGQQLKDGSITIVATNAPMPMKMVINITDRKVEGKESVTTPAGTFDCYKISSNMNLQNQMGFNMNFNFSSMEWLAPKAGTVKTETYDKNKKMIGYTLLTKRS